MRIVSPNSGSALSIQWPQSDYPSSIHDVSEFPQAELTWAHDPSKTYTLVMWDPDAPNGPYLHWAVTNIHDRLHDPKDQVIMSYTPPNPPEGDSHRYYIWIFDQNLPKALLAKRTNFSFNDQQPVATLTLIGETKHGQVSLSELAPHLNLPERAVAY